MYLLWILLNFHLQTKPRHICGTALHVMTNLSLKNRKTLKIWWNMWKCCLSEHLQVHPELSMAKHSIAKCVSLSSSGDAKPRSFSSIVFCRLRSSELSSLQRVTLSDPSQTLPELLTEKQTEKGNWKGKNKKNIEKLKFEEKIRKDKKLKKRNLRGNLRKVLWKLWKILKLKRKLSESKLVKDSQTAENHACGKDTAYILWHRKFVNMI